MVLALALRYAFVGRLLRAGRGGPPIRVCDLARMAGRGLTGSGVIGRERAGRRGVFGLSTVL
jgi:hypothetical protein